MLACTDINSGGSPSPIKSNLSVIFQKDQPRRKDNVDCKVPTSKKDHSAFIGRKNCANGVENTGENKCNADKMGFRQMDKDAFDKFMERMVQGHDKKKRLSIKKSPLARQENIIEKRTKKVRQVFTFLQPPLPKPPDIGQDRLFSEEVEIYESTGGSLKALKAENDEFSERPTEAARLPRVVPLPSDWLELNSEMLETKDQLLGAYDSISRETGLSVAESFQDAPCLLGSGTCFPRASLSQPDLYYAISSQSIPISKPSSSAHCFSNSITTSRDAVSNIYGSHVESLDLLSASKTFLTVRQVNSPKYPQGISNKILETTMSRPEPRTQNVNLKVKDHVLNLQPLSDKNNVFLHCQDLNDFLAKKISNNVLDSARGRLMSYAKFNPTFKLSEDYYEDMNERSMSRVPTVTNSLAAFSYRASELFDKDLDCIHQLNPDFDDNQSLTEGFTTHKSPYQSSSLTSVALRSDLIAKVYQHLTKSMHMKNSEVDKKFSYVALPEDRTQSQIAFCMDEKQIDEFSWCRSTTQIDMKHTRQMDFSHESVSCVSLSRVVSTIRKQRLSDLKISLKNVGVRQQKETDLWSSSAELPLKYTTSQTLESEVPTQGKVSKRKLVDVIPKTGVFNSSSSELLKRPVYKWKRSYILDPRTSKLTQEFVSKAHHYLCSRDYYRSSSNRCFFRTQPAIRLLDQTTQCPDAGFLSGDRSIGQDEIQKSETEESVPLIESNFRQPIVLHSSLNQPLVTQAKCTTETPIDYVQSCDYAIDQHISEMSQTFETATCKKATCKRVIDVPCENQISGCSIYHYKPSTLRPSKLIHSDESYVKPALRDYQDPATQFGPEISINAPNSKPFSQSFRALCDKRRIRIRYENGKYTVYKELDRTQRRTVWSVLTGKATNLFSSVIQKKPHQKTSFRNGIGDQKTSFRNRIGDS